MQKRLYRTTRERVLGGVCAGLADYFEIDPVIVRLIFLVALLVGGGGLFAYVVLWVLMPEKEQFSQTEPAGLASELNADPTFNLEPQSSDKSKGTTIAGIALIVLGVVLLADMLIPQFSFKYAFPILLMGVGGALLWRTFQKSE
ncbi:MAG: hypothetical protein HY22_13260 [[Candidatus Thermochlorobacteriaceae] bacterium GBChlB]|nr:MAG: hypothetical protein HY22_13260 [[Candidatus Thermochlorobacteriaceae] bacterium GBChlB]